MVEEGRVAHLAAAADSHHGHEVGEERLTTGKALAGLCLRRKRRQAHGRATRQA
jgi:hypothetical protein